uniref:Uncharacterized protein n=1 Tax=Tanacetum cinerariifolium TaxID=118510 RepID=A0A6L2JSB6_TANCI|nr:hypothetical protein [Tanacetum cinerariifolium]
MDQPKSSHAKKTDASDSASSCSETFKPFQNYMSITERQLIFLKCCMLRLQRIIRETMKKQQPLILISEPLWKVTMQADISSIKGMVTKMFQAFKGIYSSTPSARDTDELPPKLVKASTKVHPYPNTPLLVPYEIHGKMYQLTEEEIQARLNKVEKLEKAAKEARLSKSELIKVVHKEATKTGVDPKIKKAKELRKKRIDQYRWTITSRLKPETIIDIRVHPNSKPVIITVYRGNDQRNFDIHNPFKFGDFAVTELDKLGQIIQKKKNKMVGKLMTSLGKRYERLKKIPEELRVTLTLPAPGQVLSLTLGRKRKIQELECNRSLPEGILFVNNLVIE